MGSLMLASLEAEHPVTGVGVVSCRSDILPWYTRRGYTTYMELPLDEVRRVESREARLIALCVSPLSATKRH